MLRNLLICTLVAIVTFGAGYFTCQKVNNVEFLKEANSFKYELIEAQEDALDKASKVIWNNNLVDADGSDDMADYLEAHSKVCDLYSSQL